MYDEHLLSYYISYPAIHQSAKPITVEVVDNSTGRRAKATAQTLPEAKKQAREKLEAISDDNR